MLNTGWRVQPGKVMFEMAGVDEELAREAFRLASAATYKNAFY